MKRQILLVILAFCIIGLVGCNDSQEGHQVDTQIEDTQPDIPQNDEEWMLVDIIDRFNMEVLYKEVEEECFYSDDKYSYCFNYEKSDMVDVCYSNDTKENVKDALANGHITIEDLDEFDISYYRKAKFEITDQSLVKYIVCPEGKEVIYEDEKYEYFFDRIRSEYVEVTYEDGSKENIKDALASGKIDIFDLSQEGIDCYVRDKQLTDVSKRKLVSIVDLTKTGCYGTDDAIEPFYKDNIYQYEFSSIMSMLVHVHYSDGTCEHVDDALENGNITIKDLDAFDIRYYSNPQYTIVDKSRGMIWDSVLAEEIIYESDDYKYYFDVPKSEYIEIQYEDGTSENAIDALQDRKITLFELKESGIGFYVLDKKLPENSDKVVAQIVDESYDTKEAIEVFCIDSEKQYFFHRVKSHSVFVYYTDGTREPIRTALEARRITIRDISKFRIHYNHLNDYEDISDVFPDSEIVY